MEKNLTSFYFVRSCTRPSPGAAAGQFQTAGSAGTGTVSESPPAVCGCVGPASEAAGRIGAWGGGEEQITFTNAPLK